MIRPDEKDRRRDETVVGEEERLVLGQDDHVRQRDRDVEDDRGVRRPGEARIVDPDVDGSRGGVHDEGDFEVVQSPARQARIRADPPRRGPRSRSGVPQDGDGDVRIGRRVRAVHGDDQLARRETSDDLQIEMDAARVWLGSADVERLPPITAVTGPEQPHLEEAVRVPSGGLVGRRGRHAPGVMSPVPAEIHPAVHRLARLDALDAGHDEGRAHGESGEVREGEGDERDEGQGPQDRQDRPHAGSSWRPGRPGSHRETASRAAVSAQQRAASRAWPADGTGRGREQGRGRRRGRATTGAEASVEHRPTAGADHSSQTRSTRYLMLRSSGSPRAFRPFPYPVKKVNIGQLGCAALRPRPRIGSHEFRRIDGMEYEEKGRRNVEVQFETIKSEKLNFGRNNFLEVARKRAKTSDGTNEFISVSRGYYLPDKSERFKRSLTIPDDPEIRAFVAEKIRTL